MPNHNKTKTSRTVHRTKARKYRQAKDAQYRREARKQGTYHIPGGDRGGLQ